MWVLESTLRSYVEPGLGIKPSLQFAALVFKRRECTKLGQVKFWGEL